MHKRRGPTRTMFVYSSSVKEVRKNAKNIRGVCGQVAGGFVVSYISVGMGSHSHQFV